MWAGAENFSPEEKSQGTLLSSSQAILEFSARIVNGARAEKKRALFLQTVEKCGEGPEVCSGRGTEKIDCTWVFSLHKQQRWWYPEETPFR